MATTVDQVVIKRIKVRIDSEANWIANSTVLNDGELGISKPDRILKMGDGVSTWVQLDPYIPPITEDTDNILEVDAEGHLKVETQINDTAASGTKTYSSTKINELTSQKLNVVSINLENSPLVPVQAGVNVYLRYTRALGTNLLINSTAGFETGMVFNVRAAGGDVVLTATGVTLSYPPSSSNLIPNGGNVSIVFTSANAADVFGVLEIL